MKITLHKIKETKGTRVFAAGEDEDNPEIRTLYIAKHGIDKDVETIVVEVKPAK